MREIKFRALSQTINGTKYWDYYSIGQNLQFNTDLETVGQYTGLKDKNGKEIYEGDIVKTSIGIQVVKDLFCNLVIYTYEDIDRMNQPEKYLEIIGNIYESKHLLDNTDTKA